MWRPFCCLRTSYFPQVYACGWGWGRGEGRGERGRRRGEAGDSGGTEPLCSIPPAFLLLSWELWGQQDLALRCWRRPPSQRPRGTTAGAHHGPSFLYRLLKPAFPLYHQDTQPSDPKPGPPPRGRAGLSLPTEPAAPGPPWAAHTFSAPARESPTLLTDPSPQTVGPDGDRSHGPTLCEAPQ